MATPITLLAEHRECEVDKLKLLGIEVRDVGGQYILETNCIVDTGADISCTTNEVREALGSVCDWIFVFLGGAPTSISRSVRASVILSFRTSILPFRPSPLTSYSAF